MNLDIGIGRKSRFELLLLFTARFPRSSTVQHTISLEFVLLSSLQKLIQHGSSQSSSKNSAPCERDSDSSLPEI